MSLPGISALLLLSAVANADDSKSGFTENIRNNRNNARSSAEQKKTDDIEATELAKTEFIQSAHLTYAKYNNRVRVPGFISATPIPKIGRIAGPVTPDDLSYRMGDTLYVRWAGAPLPKVGDRYATYAPAVVLQNLEHPTDFEVFNPPAPGSKIPKSYRIAGYLYETTGRLRVTKISGGLVWASVEQLSGHLGVGGELMLIPPLVENLTPIASGVQLSAAVVCGSPVDRLSTTERSFLYLNRGSRDGIRVGRVFESIETVKLDEAVGGASPELSNGEAIVIHVTESYSTAMIIKQFDVIRIGSLLRAKQQELPIWANAPFQGIPKDTSQRVVVIESLSDKDKNKEQNLKKPEKKEDNTRSSKPTEIPSLDNLPGGDDESLPEPRKRPSPAPLSDLDQLEQNMRSKELTAQEKSRLDRLSHQEKIGAGSAGGEGDGLSDTPASPALENSFGDAKAPAKKEPKKKKSAKNEEEELNLLMMQN